MVADAYAGGAGDYDDAFKVIAVLRKTETEYHQFDAYMDPMDTSGLRVSMFPQIHKTLLKWKSSVH